MKKKTMIILAIALLAIGAAFVVAQKAAHRGAGFRGHRGMGMMFRALNLTDDQKAKVKGIRESNKTTFQPLMQSLRASHKKLADATANGNFDEAQVQALANEQAAAMAKLIVEKERMKSQIFAILTDEQKAKAAEMRDQMKERFKNRMTKPAGAEKAPEGSEF